MLKLRDLGKSTFLVIDNFWLNVSRVEEMTIEAAGCRIKLMGADCMYYPCDSVELTELLDHGYKE